MDFFFQNFDNFTLLLGLIGGVIGIFLAFWIDSIAEKKLSKRVKKLYPDESIECVLDMPAWVKAFPLFFCGVFLGAYIIPFFIFEGIVQIEMVTSENLYLYTFFVLYGCLAWPAFMSSRIFLTNKRIIAFQILGFLIFSKEYNILLCSIKSIEFKTNDVIIKFLDNKLFWTGARKNTDKFYEKVLTLWNKERGVV